MADATIADTPDLENAGGRSSKLLFVLAFTLCLLGAAAGYFGVSLGYIPVDALKDTKAVASKVNDKTAKPTGIAFVEIPPLLVTLPPGAENKHLRFGGKIEVKSDYEKDVAFLMPRIQDLMNGYLRALSAEEIEGPGAIFRIRMHLYRRIVTVVGLEKTNGLLITEFILK